MMDDDEHARWMGPEDPWKDPKDPKDPLPEAYWAAQEAVGRIVPDWLTLEERYEFLIWVKAHVYYEIVTSLHHLDGDFGYEANDIKRWMVGEYWKAQDRKVTDEMSADPS